MEKNSVIRTVLWVLFIVSCVLAAIDLLLIQGLFTWMITAPLVLVTGIANVAISLWKHESKKALAAAVATVLLCGGYVALLAWSLV